MFEAPKEAPKSPEQEEGPQARVFFIRHSRATYKNAAETLASDNPEAPFDPESQVRDLPPEGIEMAEKEAQKFFSQFEAGKDIFFIVSSTQMRALETAKIYADTARAMGMEVVEHEKTGTEIAKKVGGGSVRSIDTLSMTEGKYLTVQNQVFGTIFNPPSQRPAVNWAEVDPETRDLVEKAHAIVLADDKGSWGANFYAHAEAVKKIIPALETPEELHKTQFQNIQRLARLARTKTPEGKRLSVIGFGHENYMGKALEEDTGKHGIGNVEAVEIGEDGILKRVEI